MKKILFIVCFIYIGFIFSTKTVNAQEIINDNLSLISSEVIYFDDGSYIVNQLYGSNYTFSDNYTTSETNSSIIIGARSFIMYDPKGSVLWEYKVIGHFAVDLGVSSSCYFANYEQTIYNPVWHFSNGLSGFYSNTAYGKGTFKHIVLLITLKTVNVDISVSCDVYGNLY